MSPGRNRNDHERVARVHPASPNRIVAVKAMGADTHAIAGYSGVIARLGDSKMTAKSGQIRIGIGGWTFEPWRGVFYPKGLPQAKELAYASERLTSI